jgi:hypothetical protein
LPVFGIGPPSLPFAIPSIGAACLTLTLSLLPAAEPLSTNPPAAPPAVATAATNPPARPAANIPDHGSIRFLNGDILRGRLLSIDAQQLIRWENTAIHGPMEIAASDVARIRLPPAPAPTTSFAPDCQLHLLNGDEVFGRLVSLDAERAVLDTWYAGVLSFTRPAIQWLRLSHGVHYVYEGPTGLDGWTITESRDAGGDKAWGYLNGVFYARRAGGIARDLKLPDRAAIDLDVTWRNFLQFTVTMYTDSLSVYQLSQGVIVGGLGGGLIIQGGQVQVQGQPAPAPAPQPPKGAGFYALQFNQGYVYLMTVRKNGQIQNAPMEQLPDLSQKSRVRVGIRADRKEKTLSLLLDGALVKTWVEPEDWAGQGTCIRFVQQGQAPVNLSNIKVAEWDGKLEKPLQPAVPGPTNDFVLLRNQDALAGAVQNIRDGALAVATAFGPLTIPLERVTQINLAGARGKLAVVRDGDVRAALADRGVLTFRVKEWNDRHVSATNAHFGSAQFNPAAFSRLDFNLQRPGELDLE